MATARKGAATRPRTPASTTAKVEDSTLDVFNEYRSRASSFTTLDQAAEVSIPPYVLGPEMGFDPPIKVEFPDDIERMFLLDRALSNNNYFAALDVLFGGSTRRILRRFKSEPDPERLLIGLIMTITDHFMGKGASTVPGGSSPS